MAALLKKVGEDILEGMFINGLDEEVQVEVLMANLVGLSQIMDMAQRVEDRNKQISKAKDRERPRFRSAPPIPTRFKQRTIPWNTVRGTTTPEKVGTTVPSAKPGFKLLSQAVIQAKKEKGLCFRCDEKYTIEHQCRNRELQVLLVDDEVEEERTMEKNFEETPWCNELESVELAMNSVVGLTSLKTMKLRGVVEGQEVVLIDSGATHNFMSWELIRKLNQLISETNG